MSKSAGAQQVSNQLNMRILQKLDPTIHEILFTGRHVVLYNFENEEKAEIEGTLFVVRNSEGYLLIILNRQKTLNFVQSLESIESIQLENEFIMFSGYYGVVHGLWFFSKDELAQFYQFFNAHANADAASYLPSHSETSPIETPTPSIVTLLNQAIQRKKLQEVNISRTQRKLEISHLFDKLIESKAVVYRNDRCHFLEGLTATIQSDKALWRDMMDQYWEYADLKGT